MKWTITFPDASAADVVTVLEGELTVYWILTWLEELVRCPEWRPGMRVLLDARGVTPGTLSGLGVWTIARAALGDKRLRNVVMAVVVTDRVVYGLLRIWQVASGGLGWRTEIFDDPGFASTWLAGTPSSQPA